MRKTHMKQKGKRGQIWISAVLYILIASVAMVLILQSGIPILENIRDSSMFARTRDLMLSVDRNIRDVASEGQGAQRIIPIEIPEGNIFIEDGRIKWEFESDTKLIEPRTKISLGNVDVYSEIDVDSGILNDNAYRIENLHIAVDLFRAVNKDTIFTDLNGIVKKIVFKDTGTELHGQIKFKVGECALTPYSLKGWTEIQPPGNNTRIGGAKVIYHMTENCGEQVKDYDLELSLESEADFIKANVKNMKYKI